MHGRSVSNLGFNVSSNNGATERTTYKFINVKNINKHKPMKGSTTKNPAVMIGERGETIIRKFGRNFTTNN